MGIMDEPSMNGNCNGVVNPPSMIERDMIVVGGTGARGNPEQILQFNGQSTTSGTTKQGCEFSTRLRGTS
jgi:hypothetical protein